MKTPGVDLDDARAFITALTGAGDSSVTFQTFSDRKPPGVPADGKDPLARILHGTLEEHADELARLNVVGAGVFLMVAAGDGKGRSGENVVALRAVFTDNDGTPEKAHALPPSFSVASHHGPHDYWRLQPGELLAEFTPAQKQLAAYYGTDTSIHDLPRVMRVPGFIHRKAEPFLVTFRPGPNRIYTLKEIVTGHPVAASAPSRRPSPTRASSDAVRTEKLIGIVRAAAAGRSWAEGSRHQSAKETATHARKLWLDKADALAIVSDFLTRAGKDSAEAGGIVEWAWASVAPDPKEQTPPANVIHITSDAEHEVQIEEILPEPEKWPDPVDEAAYHGVLGELTRLIEPHTEADPFAVLLHNIVMFGNAVGHGPQFRVGATRHYAVESAVFVGVSSKGRKGTAEAEARRPYQIIEDPWSGRITSGLSTGEGLLHAVRDPIEKSEPIRDGKGRGGKITGYENVIIDPGEQDKRALALEPEWGRVLRVMEREGSTLSSVIRQLWDCPPVAEVKTRSSPIRATAPHVSIIGHVTRDELLRYLDRTDQANGFANRFLYALVCRSRELPNGGNLTDADLRPLAQRLRLYLAAAREIGEMTRTPEAQQVWEAVYSPLSRARDGIVGGITNRAEAHVVRLSMIYALADGRAKIDASHLEAALALWTYCEDSANAIFGASLGNPEATSILRNLRYAPEGLTRTELHGIFGRNLVESKLTLALDFLNRRGLARGQRETVPGRAGRPSERWFAISPDTRKNESYEESSSSLRTSEARGEVPSSRSFSRAPEQQECAS